MEFTLIELIIIEDILKKRSNYLKNTRDYSKSYLSNEEYLEILEYIRQINLKINREMDRRLL